MFQCSGNREKILKAFREKNASTSINMVLGMSEAIWALQDHRAMLSERQCISA